MTTPRLDRLDKNFIINGAFDFWQRGGVSAAVNISTSQVYQSCDRFLNYYAGTVTGTPTIERSTDNPGKFARYSAKISSRRNASTVQHIHYQRIESVFARQLSNKNISIGVEVKADVATSVQLKLVSYASADAGGIGTEFEDIVKTITPGAGFQQITFEDLAMPSLANGLGVYIIVNSPTGTDATPQGTWITELQVKIGKKVQDFSYFGRDYRDELLASQRYFEKSYELDVLAGTITGVGQLSASQGVSSQAISNLRTSFKSSKRNVPIITWYSPTTGTIDRVRGSDAADKTVIASINPSTQFTGYPNVSANQSGILLFGHFTADAEI